MEKEDPNRNDRDSRKFNLILYGLGVILLAVFLIVGLESVRTGFFVLLAYIPLYVFLRYIQRHGGMGWQWPA